jgi:hypothetical protein
MMLGVADALIAVNAQNRRIPCSLRTSIGLSLAPDVANDCFAYVTDKVIEGSFFLFASDECAF